MTFPLDYQTRRDQSTLVHLLSCTRWYFSTPVGPFVSVFVQISCLLCGRIGCLAVSLFAIQTMRVHTPRLFMVKLFTPEHSVALFLLLTESTRGFTEPRLLFGALWTLFVWSLFLWPSPLVTAVLFRHENNFALPKLGSQHSRPPSSSFVLPCCHFLYIHRHVDFLY